MNYQETTIDKATHFTTELIPGIQKIQGFNQEKTCVSYKGGTYIGTQFEGWHNVAADPNFEIIRRSYLTIMATLQHHNIKTLI
jgi:hypothetical protein